MFILYDLIFLVLAILYLPAYLLKRRLHKDFALRLGKLPKDFNLDRPIWIHAVSVGEVMSIKGFLEELRQVCPGKKFVISTITTTGNKIARSLAREDDFVTYLPLDFSFIVRDVINKINPRLFIIVETELWPNLICCLYNKEIPIILVNGRISDKSFKRYFCIKFLLRPILNKITLFCVQTERDAQRFIRLGVLKNKIQLTGNMKFDTTDCTDKKSTDYADYRKKLGLEPAERFLAAGSTHPGEEEILLGTYKKLKVELPLLRLMLAPRHPERTAQIEDLITKYGFVPLRISQLAHNLHSSTKDCVFILDGIGELLNFYAIADIVFVGGSLVKKGGHNILEPASLGKPVLFGPYMFNFHEIAELFLKKGASIRVDNQPHLEESIRYLLNNPSEIKNTSINAKRLIAENLGANKKNIELTKKILEDIRKK